jgi:hypothetical protein
LRCWIIQLGEVLRNGNLKIVVCFAAERKEGRERVQLYLSMSSFSPRGGIGDD